MLRIAYLFLLLSASLSAQTTVRFEPVFPEASASLAGGAAAGSMDVDERGETTVDVLRFYVTDLRFMKGDTVVFTDPQRHRLLNVEDSASLSISLPTPYGIAYDSLHFLLGVDSLTADGGVFGGDLDPTNGMYWTWRSGYINFKLEGFAPECPARKNRFQFHVGGFQGANNSERKIALPLNQADTAVVQIRIDQLLAGTDLSKDYRVMLPGENAMRLADRLVAIFKMKTD